jgi:hypothetical protein
VGKSAISWQKALTWYLDHDKESVQAKLELLNLTIQVLEQYLPHAPAYIRKIIQNKYLLDNTAIKNVDNAVIASNSEGWVQLSADPYVQPVLLSSAKCMIDGALSIAGREPMYRGRIITRDETFPFLEACSVVEKNISQFIQRVCTEHRAQRLPMIMTTPEKLLKITKAHANLQVRYIATGFGWDNESSSLILPNVTLSDNQYIDSELHLEDGPFSPIKITHFEAFTQQDLHILASFEAETPYVLALLISLLPVIFAPAYRMETPQTVVPGLNTDLLQRLFKFLDLPCSTKGMSPTIINYAETHQCPYFIRMQTKSPLRQSHDASAWVDTVGLYGCGYVSSLLPSVLARMTLGHANMLFLPRVRFYRWLKEKLPSVYLKCFAHALKHFSRYVLEPRIQSADWNDDLIDEAIRYFEETLGLPVDKNTLYAGYYNTASYFCDFVNLLQQYEELKITASAEGLIIPVSQLGDGYRKTIGIFDFDRIREMLTTATLLRHYDPAKHVFIVHPELFQVSQKRLETLYSLYIR